MEVIDVWTGHRACMLQSALRLTREAFADRLGISTRTVATWHSDPEVVPRSEIQQLLDSVFESAPATVRQRFALLVAGSNGKSTEASGPQPQALRVAIAVVVRAEEVLLVCRRGDDASGITWQFPAGVIKPGVRPETATIRETLDETGVHCVYFLCEYLAGDATNSDVVENVDVAWVPKNAVGRFISADTIYPPILAALEEDA